MSDRVLIQKTGQNNALHGAFLERYPNLPNDYKSFLNEFVLVANKEDTTWFLSVTDFNDEALEEGFAWNEFELQSLTVFEGDEVSQAVVREFWDAHLPIVLSVKGGYSFFAIGVAEVNFGKIYFGEEPEYEDVVFVADSFTKFFDQIKRKELLPAYQDLF